LYQCSVCKDDFPKCTDLALARQCIEGDRQMLTNCPQSCGLCQGRTCWPSSDWYRRLVTVQWHHLRQETFFLSIIVMREKKLLGTTRFELLMDTCLKYSCEKRHLIDTACVHGTRVWYYCWRLVFLLLFGLSTVVDHSLSTLSPTSSARRLYCSTERLARKLRVAFIVFLISLAC